MDKAQVHKILMKEVDEHFPADYALSDEYTKLCNYRDCLQATMTHVDNEKFTQEIHDQISDINERLKIINFLQTQESSQRMNLSNLCIGIAGLVEVMLTPVEEIAGKIPDVPEGSLKEFMKLKLKEGDKNVTDQHKNT